MRIGRLGGDEFHRRTLHCLGVAEIVFLPFAIGAHVFRGRQPCIVTKRLQLAAQVMRAHAGLHPDQAIAPSQHHSLVGQERGRTIPLAEVIYAVRQARDIRASS